MQPEAIFNQYLSYANESDRILASYKSYVQQLANQHLQLELTFLHRNIRFMFSKLITMLCNRNLWDKVAEPCLREGYNPSADISIMDEVKFLTNNRERIIEQFKCIHNTTVFETDLLFLEKCFGRLNNAYLKVEKRYWDSWQDISSQTYLIAS